MEQTVRSIFKTRTLRSIPLPSLAGRGLPERMRTTAFVFLGLTAAAGLALVATFAQLGVPLLAPAPLPGQPGEARAVAEAVALTADGSVAPATPAASGRGNAVGGGREGTNSDRSSAGDGGTPAGDVPAAGDDPSPAPLPGSDPGGDGSPVGQHEPAEPAPAPAPAPVEPTAAAPSSAPAAAPVVTPPPAGATSTGAKARAAASSPVRSPGRSTSSAATSHASARGVEASSKSAPPPPPPPPPPPAAPAAPGPTPQVGSPGAPPDGNGKALGHTK